MLVDASRFYDSCMQRGRQTSTTAATARQRSAAERSFVLVVAGAFAAVMVSIAGMQASTAYQQSKSKALIGESLEQVGRHQSSFRQLHGRFATWAELAERGERMAEGLEVLRSNATASHWYMQLLHRNSGLVCDRIHDLSAEWNAAPEPQRCRDVAAR
jgi:hypothetical protein